MAPNYTLVYFNIRGRGEIVRLALSAAGQKFEDKRVEFKDWPEEQKVAPLGTLPYLIIDGKTKVPQSLAIVRYIAREHGLYGKDKMDNVQVDVFLDTVLDMAETAYKAFFEKDEAKKKEMDDKFNGETCPKMLGNMEKMASDAFLVGKSLTVADLYLYSVLENIKMVDKLDKFPKLKKAIQSVTEDKNVKAYLASRPKTDM